MVGSHLRQFCRLWLLLPWRCLGKFVPKNSVAAQFDWAKNRQRGQPRIGPHLCRIDQSPFGPRPPMARRLLAQRQQQPVDGQLVGGSFAAAAADQLVTKTRFAVQSLSPAAIVPAAAAAVAAERLALLPLLLVQLQEAANWWANPCAVVVAATLVIDHRSWAQIPRWRVPCLFRLHSRLLAASHPWKIVAASAPACLGRRPAPSTGQG